MFKSISKLPAAVLCCSLFVGVGCTSHHDHTIGAAQKSAQPKPAADPADQNVPAPEANTPAPSAETSKPAPAPEVAQPAPAPQEQTAKPSVASAPETLAPAPDLEKQRVEDVKTSLEKAPAKSAVLVLVSMWSESADAFNAAKAKLAKLDSSGTLSVHSADVQMPSGPAIRGEFLVSLNSSDAFKGFMNEMQSQKAVSVVPVVVTEQVVRSYLTITYADGDSRDMFIGNSSFGSLPENFMTADKTAKVETFTHAFENCATVTAECLKDLIKQGYLKQDVQVTEKGDTRTVSQISFLNSEAAQSIQTANDDKNSRFKINLFGRKLHVISDIRIDHELWLLSTATLDATHLSDSNTTTGEKLVEYSPKHGGLIYKAPLKIQSTPGDAKLALQPEALMNLKLPAPAAAPAATK